MEWLINVKLPFFLGDEDEFPHTDMVVAPNWCPGWILDQMIKEQACEIFDCLDEALMCIFLQPRPVLSKTWGFSTVALCQSKQEMNGTYTYCFLAVSYLNTLCLQIL